MFFLFLPNRTIECGVLASLPMATADCSIPRNIAATKFLYTRCKSTARADLSKTISASSVNS